MHCWDGDSQRKIRVSDYSSGYCTFPSTLNLKAFEQEFSKLTQTTCGRRESSLKASEQQAPKQKSNMPRISSKKHLKLDFACLHKSTPRHLILPARNICIVSVFSEIKLSMSAHDIDTFHSPLKILQPDLRNTCVLQDLIFYNLRSYFKLQCPQLHSTATKFPLKLGCKWYINPLPNFSVSIHFSAPQLSQFEPTGYKWDLHAYQSPTESCFLSFMEKKLLTKWKTLLSSIFPDFPL